MRIRRNTHYAQFGHLVHAAMGSDATWQSLRRGTSVTVSEWERALLFGNGRMQRVLAPGKYRLWQGGLRLRVVDLRPWVLRLPTQEAPTADGATVKVNVAGQARVSDPVAYVTATRDAEQALYLSVQVAVRDLLAGVSTEDLLAGRGGFGEQLLAGAGDTGQFGIGIDQLVIKDIMLSGELKKAQAEVLVARAQGVAALERARGETAALRSLANAARLAAANPALLQLRLLQHLAGSAGHTVVIGQAQLAGPAGLAGQHDPASTAPEVPAG